MKWLKRIGKILGVVFLLFLIFNIIFYTYCFITPKISINEEQAYYLYDKMSNWVIAYNGLILVFDSLTGKVDQQIIKSRL